jgi:chemotaxis protein methyltransferase CheR
LTADRCGIVPMDYAITDEEFDQFRTLVYQESGISLNDGKKSLLISRLSKRLRALGLESFEAYYDRVTQEPGGDEFTRMLDLVSTNKTDFFREPKHFDFLRERILPSLIAEKRIRIWSSACSSGEEPYTIAMTVHDGVVAPLQWDCKILASDLSTQVLAKAAAGVYADERVCDLPADTVRRHFMKGRGKSEGMVKVKPYLSDMIVFRRINLMDDRFPIKALRHLPQRDDLLRRPTQQQLMASYRYLKPGGHLFIGHSNAVDQTRVRLRGADDLPKGRVNPCRSWTPTSRISGGCRPPAAPTKSRPSCRGSFL